MMCNASALRCFACARCVSFIALLSFNVPLPPSQSDVYDCELTGSHLHLLEACVRGA